MVCLLGLDDGAFPRKAPRDGDDLMLDDPHIGERDPRSEDRQLLLDALLAATERLIITYTGNDERTNTPRPTGGAGRRAARRRRRTPPVPSDGAVRERIVIRHPLQPFDPRNFSSGRTRSSRAAAGALTRHPGRRPGAGRAAHRAAAVPRRAAAAPAGIGSIELEDLVRFVEHPVRAFLRQRLGIGLWGGADEIEDALPVELDPLERWGVGQRLLEARLTGVDGNAAIKAEIARGTLPPGRARRCR